MATSHTVYLPFKVSPEIRDKLDGLAKAVRKSRSATLRALILAADVDDLPSAWRNIPEDEKELVAQAEGRPA
jgi:predicted transcriptional regulator